MAREEYDELRRMLYLSDPRLKRSTINTAPPRGAWRPWSRDRGRVVALHFSLDGLSSPPTEYGDATALESHLEQSVVSQETSSRSVYLFEGLSGGFCGVLGSYFQLHPSLMMDHERLAACDDRTTGENGGLPFLSSTIYSRDYVSLKYHEPMVLSHRPMGFRNLCDTSGRHLAITRLMGELSTVAISRRKCTFWCKHTASDGWKYTHLRLPVLFYCNFSVVANHEDINSGLIICDPPVHRIITDYSGKTGYDVGTAPYNSGYLDFMPLPSQMESRSGPPRSSLLEDLLFYLQNYSHLLNLSSPMSLRVFVEKIVASQYLKLAEYLQSNVEIVQWNLSRKQDLTNFEVSSAEEIWSDIQAWERRIGEYQDDLEGIMLQLRLPLESPDLSQTWSWKDSMADFQHLMIRFRRIGERTHALNSAVAALASLVGNRATFRAAELSLREYERSGREAKSVKALTILGIVFLPLSFSASLFSMSDRYLPGRVMFWVYLAVSMPLLGLVILIYSITELGYVDNGIQWSLKPAIRKLRGK